MLLCAAAAAAPVAFAAAGQPFVWLLPWWAILAATAALTARNTGARVVLINLVAVLVALGGFEGYLVLRELRADPTRYAGSYTQEYFDADELLGYAPRKDVVATAEKYHGERLIYRVRYTIGADGLRVAPPAASDARGCVLFFGGSVTFGEGVADEQTMPYQVGVLTAGAYRIYNFAFHGYGPHQMLAALEGGRVDAVIQCRPTHVIYQAILPHVERAAGLATWDQHGPRYRRVAGGGVVRDGHFDDELLAQPWKGWLQRWLTYDVLFGRRRSARAEDVALFAGVVAAARAFVIAHYDGAQFHVLLWDSRFSPANAAVLAALQSHHLDVHRISEILPGYPANMSRFELDEYDHHPNAAANAVIARYVADQVIHYRR